MRKTRKILLGRVFFGLCAASLFTIWLSYLYPLPPWLLVLGQVLALPTYPILAIRLAWGAVAPQFIRPRFGIRNRRDVPQVVDVEPWGEDFTLMPGEELEVVAFSDSTLPWFSVVEWAGIAQVFCNHADEFEVLQSGVRLGCGHNRQPEPAA